MYTASKSGRPRQLHRHLVISSSVLHVSTTVPVGARVLKHACLSRLLPVLEYTENASHTGPLAPLQQVAVGPYLVYQLALYLARRTIRTTAAMPVVVDGDIILVPRLVHACAGTSRCESRQGTARPTSFCGKGRHGAPSPGGARHDVARTAGACAGRVRWP